MIAVWRGSSMDYGVLTVAQLKELLRERNLPVSGKKAELIIRLNGGEAADHDGGAAQKAEPAVVDDLENMTVKQLQDMLRERDLSVNGKKEVLITRLATRLEKEKDPMYVPKAKKKAKICAWCGSGMVKRSGRKGEFYGCAAYPSCQYTTSLSGYAKPSREALRGVSAPDVPYSTDRLAWARRKGDLEDRREREQERRDEKLYGC